MKVIPEIRSNLLTDPSITVIIQQCKTVNKFDKGLAAQIKTMYPQAWEADCSAAAAGRNGLGNYSWAKVGPNKYVFNVYSCSTIPIQSRWTDYNALRKGLEGVKWYVETHLDSPSIGVGHIGCSYGGDWNIVRKILSEVFTSYNGVIKIIDITGA